RWVSDFQPPKVSDVRPPLTTRRDRGGPRDRRAVLNAFRRRRFHHQVEAIHAISVSTLCSTPFGVEGSITGRAALPHADLSRVLNAFRRRRFHHHASPLDVED